MNGTAKITDEMTMQRHKMVEKLRDDYKIADQRVLGLPFAIERSSGCRYGGIGIAPRIPVAAKVRRLICAIESSSGLTGPPQEA